MELLVRHIVTHVLNSIPTVDTTDVRQYGTDAAMTKSCLSCSGVQVLVVMGSGPRMVWRGCQESLCGSCLGVAGAKVTKHCEVPVACSSELFWLILAGQRIRGFLEFTISIGC